MSDTQIVAVRRFRNRRMMGVGFDDRSWFVYDKEPTAGASWHKHCGPYSASWQAAEWIFDIKDNSDYKRAESAEAGAKVSHA